MSLLRNLFNRLCPNGVEEFTLKEIGEIQGVGVDKKIIPGEKEVLLLNYMDVYNNRCLSKDTLSMVVTASDHKISQCNILYGDVFITPTSETIDDIGHAAVAMENIPMAVYSYHVCRFRLFLPSIVSSHYISYYFRTKIFQDQVVKYATGLTRFGLTKGKFENLKILFPPLPIQEEIVRVLDKFTLLKAELEAELEARTMQYEHYRDALLDFSPKAGATRPMFMQNLINENCLSDVAYYKLIDLCLKVENIRWSDNESKTYDYIDLSSVDRDNKKIVQTEIIDVMTAPSRAQQIIQTEDIIYGTTRPTLKRYCFVPQEYNGQICSTGYCVLRVDKSMMLPKFLYYLVSTRKFDLHVEMFQRGSAYPAISDIDLKNFEVPVPSLPVQEAIVDILDRFEAIVHDIQDGLPAEIALRQKQYEYYRDKLLTFEPLETETKAA
mgnify:CR=1 FL=1|jgi:type I restriction enzyme S subunit